MLQLENETAFAAERAMLMNRNGDKIWVVVVKATLKIENDGACTVDAEQEPVSKVPRYLGKPGLSTLLRETELVTDHPGTSVTINGSAYAPPGSTAHTVEASLEVGSVRKSVRVTGERRWIRSVGRLRMTDPVPFSVMPLTFERSFGGRDELPDGRLDSYDRNPAGRGFASAEDRLEDRELPNLEYPHDAVQNPASRPAPAGFSAVPASWSPRRELAGTFDQRWLSRRSPLWPDDYDPRHQLAAPPDQVATDRLRVGERVTLRNFTPDGLLQFPLPLLHFSFDTFLRAGRVSHRGNLDRVIIEPDSRRLLMVWRAALNCGSDARAVEATVIGLKKVLR